MVETIKEVIKDTHIHDTSVETTRVNSVVTVVGIIGQGGSRAINGGRITQSIIRGRGSIIHSNVITHVLTSSSKMTLKRDSFPFDPLNVQTLVITPLT